MSDSLFDYINDLSYGKKDLSRLNPDEFTENYSPYMINKAFSMGIDTLLYANEMNKYPDISKQMHYDYYLFSLKKQKRFNKWAKEEKNEYLDLVCEYYQITTEKALDLIRILPDTSLENIKAKLNRGGKMKRGNK